MTHGRVGYKILTIFFIILVNTGFVVAGAIHVLGTAAQPVAMARPAIADSFLTDKGCWATNNGMNRWRWRLRSTATPEACATTCLQAQFAFAAADYGYVCFIESSAATNKF